MPDFEASTLAQLFARHASLSPAAIALLAPGSRSISYAQLLGLTRSAGPWLASHGLSSASRIALLMPGGIELAVATLAIGAQATCIPLHAGLPDPELRALLVDARADAIVGLPGDAMAARLAQALGLACLGFDLDRWLAGATEDAVDFSGFGPGPSHTAFVLFTSGTTGRPKRVPLGQRQLVGSACSIATHLALTPSDRALCLMPLHHSHGLVGGLLAPLAAGSSVVCTPAFEARDFMGWITEFNPSWYTAAPTLHHAIADLAAREGVPVPVNGVRALRLVRSASSALPAALLHRTEALWGVPVIESYGMTESATQLASHPLPPALRKAGSVGRAVGAQLRVVDAHGRELPAGQVGAVVARGPALFEGYEDDPGATAEVFQDGWFLTGDLGRFDADGDLFLTGRSKELINRGGEKISPFEVEQALMRLPGVAQAVAYPAPHPTLGEDVHALVVPAPGCVVEGHALRSALFGLIADFKIPARIQVVAKIPEGPGGKVRRRELHQQIPELAGAGPLAAPLSPLQTQIAALFAQILDLPAIDSDPNFLAIGGDSLSAGRMVLVVNQTWGVDLHATALLAHPTVTTFAATLQAAIDEADALSEAFRTELDALDDDDVARLLGNDPPRP